MTDRDILRAAYQRVREHSDQEVHGLIDDLERVSTEYGGALEHIKNAIGIPLVSNDPTEIESYRKVAEDGARLMAHDGPYPPDWPKNDRFHGLMCDVFDCRDGK